MAVSSDIPIITPSQDAYGIDGFAQAIARSIANADASEGLVLAVNGAWGSGKSSACNLIFHHLKADIDVKRIVPVTFNPWWFSGAEALTFSFFQELNASIGQSLGKKAKEKLAALGTRVSKVGPLLGGLVELTGVPGAGAATSAGADIIGKWSSPERTVEQEHKDLSEELREEKKKFLVIIDDIDRLSTDDALQIFRLIKSVGRLPNVIYLLAFDRALAEAMIASRFPSEGPSYLEKAIQAGFDLPLPDPHDLRQSVLRVAEQVMGSPNEEKMVRFFNLFYDISMPLIRTPRDSVRISNAIRVSWPAIKDDADRADFLALESLRLFLPSVHSAIRANPDMLCDMEQMDRGGRNNDASKRYDDTFLKGLNARETAIARKALLRLFPRMESIWSNTWHTDGAGWQRDRLVCSKRHFPTYFSFSVHQEAVSAAEVDRLLQSAGDANAVAQLFRELVGQERRRGGTRAALVLEELMVRASEIREADIPQLLEGLFSIADEIDVPADDARGFETASNRFRIHWILNNLVRDRFDQVRRTELIENACAVASLDWLVDIANRCDRDHRPREGDNRDRKEPLVTNEAAERLMTRSLQKLREAARTGALLEQRSVTSLLFRWRDLADVQEVRQWTDAQLANNKFVVVLAEKMIHTSWSQGMGGFGSLGDVVARRDEYVRTESYTELLDIERFRRRVDELLARQDLAENDRAVLERFKATPERDPERG